MVVVPDVKPVAIPEALIVATVSVLLDHVPPEVVLAIVAVCPSHIAAGPVIAAGNGLMVTVTLPSGPQQPPSDCALK